MSFKANTVVVDLGSEKVEMMFTLSVGITSHQNFPYK